jgi:transposase
VIDVMTRLKVHHLSEGGVKQAAIAEKVGISLRSVERILNEEEPPTRDEVVRDGRVAGRRIGRRPKASPEIIEQIRLLLAAPEHGRITAIEVLRRAKEWGFTGGRSQMTELVRSLRPEVANEPVVRFEGLPGEYAQFDFGECELTTAAGLVTRAVLRGSAQVLAAHARGRDRPGPARRDAGALASSAAWRPVGGSPKEWVFDNAKTIRISKFGGSSRRVAPPPPAARGGVQRDLHAVRAALWEPEGLGGAAGRVREEQLLPCSGRSGTSRTSASSSRSGCSR